MRAAGGTSVPLMLDWLMWLSIPNVNAEWEKPAATEREAGVSRGPKAACLVSGAHVAVGRPASGLGRSGGTGRAEGIQQGQTCLQGTETQLER